jgi:signal transduction histidine kinase
VEFIVRHVFLRVSSKNDMFDFSLLLDPALPLVPVNEFTIWEILEPLIQNSIDHGGKSSVMITIATRYDSTAQTSTVTVADTGVGIAAALLEPGPRGIKRIFLEDESTKAGMGSHSGYGCYIAYQMAAGKCGWQMDADNQPSGGARFTMTIHHQERS